MDEKRFDIDSSFNVQYEMLKKRIDKATIKGSDERIVEKEKITIVYSNDKEEKEYLNYIKYLQFKQILETDFEKFLLSTLKKDSLYQDEATLQKTVTQQMAQLSEPWFQYFIKFNPADYLLKIRIPTLAINGGLDLQVAADENLQGIKSALTKAGNKKLEVKKFDRLNHLFQHAETGSPMEYGQIEETIAPEVLNTISSWILQLK